MTEEQKIKQNIYDVFEIWPINVGALAFARWTENSDLDLAIGYDNTDEFIRIMKIVRRYNVQEITSKFMGHKRINYVIKTSVQLHDSLINCDLQIRHWDEIDYLIKGARLSVATMNPKDHIDWNEYKNRANDKKEIKSRKIAYYCKVLPELY